MDWAGPKEGVVAEIGDQRPAANLGPEKLYRCRIEAALLSPRFYEMPERWRDEPLVSQEARGNGGGEAGTDRLNGSSRSRRDEGRVDY